MSELPELVYVTDSKDPPDRVVNATAQAISDAHFGTIPGDIALILARAAIEAALAEWGSGRRERGHLMIDLRQLREALDLAKRYGVTRIDGEPIVAAARFALTVMEQGEKLRYCLEHDAAQPSNDGPGGFDRCYEWWIGEYNPEDPPLSPCRMVSSFRFPAALLDQEADRG